MNTSTSTNTTYKELFNIGQRIRVRRKACDLTMRQLAKKLTKAIDDATFTESSIGHYELGKRAFPIEYIPTLCSILECDSGYIFGEYDAPTYKEFIRKTLEENMGITA